MFLYIFLRFPTHTKQGRAEQKTFCRLLEQDGFSRLHQGLYLRYCTTQANADSHKRKIQEKIPVKCQISIIFVADKQQTYNYHYWGNQRVRKIDKKLLSPRPLIEFF